MGNSAFTPPSGPAIIVPGIVAATFGGFRRNRVINGDMRVAKRGTTFSNPTSASAYTLDRWVTEYDGSIGTFTISQQTFTPGTVILSSGELSNYIQWNQTAAGSASTIRKLITKPPDVRQFAAQIAVLTFWAFADSARNVVLSLEQNFGSGGSSTVIIAAASGGTAALTTTPTLFTAIFNVPSVSGKTIGSGSHLRLIFSLPINVTMQINVGGVQLEPTGATPFDYQPLGLEELLCARYFEALPVYVPASPGLISVPMIPKRNTTYTPSGGGADFASGNLSLNGFTCNQTAAAFQTILVDNDY